MRVLLSEDVERSFPMPPFPDAIVVIAPAAERTTAPLLLIGLNICLIVVQDSEEYIAETDV